MNQNNNLDLQSVAAMSFIAAAFGFYEHHQDPRLVVDVSPVTGGHYTIILNYTITDAVDRLRLLIYHDPQYVTVLHTSGGAHVDPLGVVTFDCHNCRFIHLAITYGTLTMSLSAPHVASAFVNEEERARQVIYVRYHTFLVFHMPAKE